jgi:hypothetical protein
MTQEAFCPPLTAGAESVAKAPPDRIFFLQDGHSTAPPTCDGRKKRWDFLPQCSQVNACKAILFSSLYFSNGTFRAI